MQIFLLNFLAYFQAVDSLSISFGPSVIGGNNLSDRFQVSSIIITTEACGDFKKKDIVENTASWVMHKLRRVYGAIWSEL